MARKKKSYDYSNSAGASFVNSVKTQATQKSYPSYSQPQATDYSKSAGAGFVNSVQSNRAASPQWNQTTRSTYTRPTYLPTNQQTQTTTQSSYIPTNQQTQTYDPLREASKRAVYNQANGFVTGTAYGDSQYQRYLEQLAQQYQTQQEKKIASDPGVTRSQKEIDDLQRQIIELGRSGSVADIQRLQSLDRQRSEKQSKLNAYKSELAGENTFDATRAYYDSFDVNGSDFAEKSKYKSTANGKDIKWDNFGKGLSETGFDDYMYDYINKDEKAIEARRLNTSQEEIRMGADDAELLQMTDDQVRLFNYLYQQDKSRAYDYIEYIRPELQAKQAQAEKDEWSAFANGTTENGKIDLGNLALSSAVSVLSKPMQTMDSLTGMAVAKLTGNEIDPNAGYLRWQRMQKGIRDTNAANVGEWASNTAADINTKGFQAQEAHQAYLEGKDLNEELKKIYNQENYDEIYDEIKNTNFASTVNKLGSTGYGSVMSQLDNVYNVAVTGGSGAPALVLMSSGAMPDAIVEAKERGMTDAQAISLGFIAAVAEYFTEKVSMEKLFDMKMIEKSGILKYIGVNAFTEGSEEVASDIINFTAEQLIAQDKGEFQQAIRDYEAQGMSHDEAVLAAFGDQAEQTMYSFIGGAMAGGGMASMIGSANQVNSAIRARAIQANSPEVSPVQKMDKEQLNNYGDFLGNIQQTKAEDQISESNLSSAAKQINAGKTVDPDLLNAIKENENTVGMLEIETQTDSIDTDEQLQEALEKYAEQEKEESSRREEETPVVPLSNNYIDGLRNIVARISDESISKTFGEEGAKIFRDIATRAVENGQTAPEAYRSISTAYNAGLNENGNILNAINLPPEDVQSLYRAGIKDAQAVSEKDARDISYASALQLRGEDVGNINTGVIDNDLVRALRNNPKQAKTVDLIDRTAKALGVRVEYVDHLDSNGLYNRATKVIQIAADADPGATFAWVFGHEITHRLQQVAPKEYRALVRQVSRALGGQFNVEIQKEINKALRDGDRITQAEAMDEAVANYVGNLVNDENALNDFVNSLRDENGNITGENRTLLQKFRDFFEKLFNRVKSVGNMSEMANVQRTIDALTKALQAGETNVSEYTNTIKDLVDQQAALTTDQEFLFSKREHENIYNKAVAWNKDSKAVPVAVLTRAGTVMEAMRQILDDPEIAKLLPNEENALSGTKVNNPIRGERTLSTVYGNESYGYSIENSTICTRSLAMELLLDRCAELMGHSLTTREAIALSQMAWTLTDEPTCQYCYVFADRLAQRRARDLYIKQRDAVLKSVGKIGTNTKIVTNEDLITPVETKDGINEDKFVLDQAIEANPKMEKQLRAYNEFLEGRKNTENQRQRFLMFLETQKAGIPLVTREQVASEQAMLDAVNENPDLQEQMHDVYDYSNKASHAKAKVEYTAYNSDILKLSDKAIDLMNREYGVRFYSYSDFHPAFILENMQMFTDAAVRGLKGLAYTKDLDYVRIFADTGVNINVSCKAIDGTTDMDAMQGADWTEAQELRNKYKNVGIVMVCTSDEQVEWALAQDWVDMVLPYHTCFSAEVGKAFNWKDYRTFQSDKTIKGAWSEKAGNVKSISPYQHANSRAKYLQLCKENNLEPRFSQWLDNPNYMKLVIETRQAYNKTKPLQPKFNLDAAKESIAKMKKRGGYNNPFGGSIEEMNALAEDFVKRMNEDFQGLENWEDGWATTKEFKQNTMRLSRRESEDGYEISGKTARWTDERIDSLIREYGASNPDYSKAYAVLMNPRDFLKLTLSDDILDKWNKGSNMAEHPEVYSLDEEQLRNNTLTPFLKIWSNDGTEITGHEGRHRMRALLEAGITSVPVVLEDLDTKYSKQTVDSMTLSSQDFGDDPVNNGATVTVNNLVPIKASNRDELARMFGGEANVRFSRRGSVAQLDNEYEEAYFDGDDERMQELVDRAAEMAGYKYKAFHHTENSFTTFDINRARRGMDIQGFFFSADPNAESEYGSVRYDTYLKMDNPYIVDSYEKQMAIPFDMSQEDAGVTAREWLQENGYDGVIRKAEYFGGEADEYIVFDSSQIKSSDPVTYDDEDNFVPLSERFNEADQDIRYSMRDSEYLELAKDPQKNEARLREMVAQAAKEAGYTSPMLYHGTDAFGFTKIDANAPGADGFSFWATDKQDMSGTYTRLNKNRTIGSATTDEGVEGGIYTLFANTSNMLEVDARFNNWNNLSLPGMVDRTWTMDGDDHHVQYFDNNGEPQDISYDEAREKLGWSLFDKLEVRWFEDDYGEISTKWDTEKNELAEPAKTRDVAEYAQNLGYDGVIFKNVYDSGKYGGYGRKSPGTVYAFFKPNEQVKSADPVTYDDAGKVIPLSDRFNEANQDIRYSRRDAEYMDLAKDPEKNRAQLQAMVDQAAKAAGYNVATYHGTVYDFTVFDRGEEGIHLGTEEQARQAADERLVTRADEDGYLYGVEEDEGIEDFINENGDPRKLMRLYAKINNPFLINGDIVHWYPDQIARVLMLRDAGKTTSDQGEWHGADISGSSIRLSAEEKAALEPILSWDAVNNEAWDSISDILSAHGYDGIKYKNQYEGNKNDYSYIAMKSSDVKSADPVTYDDNGNVIPLSERFNKANQDIRYSLRDSDGRTLSPGQAEYFKNSKAVDKNGRLMVMYHGTSNADFTVFDPRYSDDGRSLFFTSKQSVAEGYSAVSATYSPAQKYDAGELNEMIRSISNGDNYVIRQGATYKLMEVDINNQEDQVITESKNIDDIRDFYIDNYLRNMFDMPANYEVYLNLTNPLVVDARGTSWNELEDVWNKEITTGYNRMQLYNDLGHGEYEIEYSDFDGDDTRVFTTKELSEILSNWEIDQLLRYRNEIYGIYIDEDGERVPSNTRQYAEYAQRRGYDGVIFRNVSDNGVYGTRDEISDVAVAFDSNQVKDVNNQNPTDDPDIRYSRVSDATLLRRLNSEKTITVYRAMQEIDGKLYPPMAARVDGKLVEPAEFGVWYQSDESNPVDNPKRFVRKTKKDGSIYYNYKLDKANGSAIDAAYNPYWHTSRSMLNDQFTSASKRPNLVTVECEVPVSELTSGYRAEGAKDAVGEMYWHSGPVSSKLAKVGKERKVILSRYVKVNRIVSDAEAAERISEMLDGTDIKIPENVVTPSLRAELEKYGVMEGERSAINKKSRRSGEYVSNLVGIAEANQMAETVENAYMEYTNKWRNNMSAFNEVGRSGFSANMSSLVRYYNGNLDKNATDRIVRDIRNLAREMIQDKNITYADVVDKGNAIASKILWGKAGATDNMLLSEDAANAIDDVRNHMLVQILNSTTRGEGKYQRLSKEFSDYREKANERIAEVRRKRDAKLDELRQRQKEQQREAAERRSDSADRTRLLKTMKRLNNISKHASEANKALIQEIIGDYNLVAKSLSQGKADSLAELSKFIQDHMSADPDFMPTERTLKDLSRLSQKNIADLSIDEVRMLNEALLNIEHEMRYNKKLIDSQYKQHISELGNEIIEGVRNTKGIGNSKIGVFNWFQQAYDKMLATPVIRPETEILRIIGFDRNNPLYQLTYGDENSLASGQRDMVRYQWLANKRYADKFLNDRAFAETIMGKKARACEITGRRADGSTVKLKVTPDMLMALYMHAQNNHNFRHFGEWNDENGTQHGGGVTIPDFELYRKGKIAEAYRVGTRDGNLITMRKSDLNRAFQQLTDKEMSFIRSAQAYYSEMSQPEINRVSNLLLGYSIAQEENYFRINTDSNYRGTNMDAIKYDGTIEGLGFTKERIEGARNPILLIPLTEQFARDIDAHSKYIGLAIPVRNFNKAFGVNRQSYNENGEFMGTESSVQSAITGTWGSTATDYIQKLMSDIQNPKTSSEGWVKIFGKLRSFYAGSVLALNAGVAIKQAASYPTAAAEIGWVPLIKAFGNTRFQGKLDMDIINKYSPLMYLRTKGMGMQEIADLKNLNKGWLNKALNSKALNWIQDMDVMTIKKLWKASEYYVRDNFKDLEIGSEEYYQKVGQIHSRIIERTQPNYTTLQRGEILRSDSDFVRMALGMFKTQPFQNASILFEAAGELKAACRAYKVNPNSVTEAMRKTAVKKLARAVSSQIVSGLVFSLMQAAWDWIRGRDDKYKDKEGKISFASAFKQILINMGSNGFGMLPLGSVLYEVIETTIDTVVQNNGGEAFFNATAYGLDASTATGIVNDLVDAFQMLANNTTSVDLDSKNTTEKHIRDYVGVLTSAAQAFGYPADNFVKDGQAIAVNVFRVLGATGQMSKYEEEYYAKRVFTAISKDKGGYMDILYNAYDNDKDAYNKLYSIYIENDGFATSKQTSKEYIDGKMETYAKKKDMNQKKESAGTLGETSYKEIMDDVQSSPLWNKASEENRRKAQQYTLGITAVDNTNDDYAKMLDVIQGGKSVGLDPSEYILYRLALDMVKGDKSDSQARTEQALNQTGLTPREKAYLFEQRWPKAKDNPFD